MSERRYLPLERALDRLDEADAALARTMAGLDDTALKAPSLCEGWTRAHVLGHLARNAEALHRLTRRADTGEEVTAYPSAETREADIERSATQPAVRLRADVTTASAALRARLEHLRGRSDLSPVELGRSGTLAGDQVAWARLREVTYHHVDLDAGFTFADVPTEVLHAGLREAVDRLGARPTSPSLTLVASDGMRWHLGSGGPEVHGSPAGLLLWLTRGVQDGVHSARPLPSLPAWG